MLVDLQLSADYDGLVFLYETRKNLPIIKSHRHRELELNLVEEGILTYIIDGKKHTFSNGSMIWLFPGQEHQLFDRSPNLRHYVVVFGRRLIDQAVTVKKYLPLTRSKPEGDFARTLNPGAVTALKDICDVLLRDGAGAEQLRGFGQDPDCRYSHRDRDMLNAGLHYLMIYAWDCFLQAERGGQAVSLHPAVSRAVRVLGDGNVDWDLNEIARHSGLSPSHLSRLFKEQMGTSISHYRNSARLTKFFGIYGNGKGRSLTEAIYEAGFGSYSQFFKVFRNNYGYSPNQFKRLLRQ